MGVFLALGVAVFGALANVAVAKCGSINYIFNLVFFSGSFNTDFGKNAIPHSHMYFMGVFLALGVAVFGALANVAVAKCGSSIDSSVLVFWCGVICIPVGLVACSFDPRQRFISTHIVDIPASEWGELILQSE